MVLWQVLRCNLLIADDTLPQKELDSLTVFLLARKYPIEIITRNISKVLLPLLVTLLHRIPRVSSPRTVLPIVTRYSPEGRHFSKSVQPLAYLWKYDITTQHLARPPHDCIPQNRIPQGHLSAFLPNQTNISTFCSQRIWSVIATDTFVISI